MSSRYPAPRRSRTARIAVLVIALTALLCGLAIVWRTPIRSRYWAWRVMGGTDAGERAVYLTALCNAGDEGRWGTMLLVDHPLPEMRQLGMVVLQHVRSKWAQDELLTALRDPDASVRELAAVGLAARGDTIVIPYLAESYRTGDDDAASAACLAFECLGGVESVAALNTLAREAGTPARKAALIDALDGIGERACIPTLLFLLNDDRPCELPSRSARLSSGVLQGLVAAGRVPAELVVPSSQPATRTVGERAAVALGRITGLFPVFSSTQPAAERDRAVRQWTKWYAERELAESPAGAATQSTTTQATSRP